MGHQFSAHDPPQKRKHCVGIAQPAGQSWCGGDDFRHEWHAPGIGFGHRAIGDPQERAHLSPARFQRPEFRAAARRVLQTHTAVERLADPQHGFFCGRSGRPSGQPDSLQSLLSRTTRLLHPRIRYFRVWPDRYWRISVWQRQSRHTICLGAKCATVLFAAYRAFYCGGTGWHQCRGEAQRPSRRLERRYAVDQSGRRRGDRSRFPGSVCWPRCTQRAERIATGRDQHLWRPSVQSRQQSDRCRFSLPQFTLGQRQYAGRSVVLSAN